MFSKVLMSKGTWHLSPLLSETHSAPKLCTHCQAPPTQSTYSVVYFVLS